MQNKLLRSILLVVLLLLSVILGKIIGGAVTGISFLSWLGEGINFGFDPFTLDLAVMNLTLGFTFAVNIAQIVLILAAIFSYIRWIARD